MGKLFGKVMASLLSGAMLFGGTSFADGGDDLPKVLRKAKVEEVPDKAECIICLTDRVEGGVVNKDVCDVVTGCGHYFCRKCILGWMNAGRDNSDKCPMCRMTFCESARKFLSTREWLQLLAENRFDRFVSYCKKRPDVALSAAYVGVYLPLLLGAAICSSRNQKIAEIDCDVDCGDFSFDDDVDCEDCIAQ